MPRLVAGPPQHTAPSAYKLAPAEAFIPESVTATFDGTGAGGTFLPTLSIYSQDGKLIARSPASSVAAGSSAEVTFAPLLRAATSGGGTTAINVPFANWVSVAGTVAAGGAGYSYLDGDVLETNDPTVFGIGPSQDVGVNGLTRVLLLKSPGVYTTIAFARYFADPAPNPDEPGASLMYCFCNSLFYPGTELDSFEWFVNGATGRPSVGFPAGGRNRWNPWSSDSLTLSAAQLPPINTNAMEYEPALYNGGGQTMNVKSYLLSIRWSESEAQFF